MDGGANQSDGSRASIPTVYAPRVSWMFYTSSEVLCFSRALGIHYRLT